MALSILPMAPPRLATAAAAEVAPDLAAPAPDVLETSAHPDTPGSNLTGPRPAYRPSVDTQLPGLVLTIALSPDPVAVGDTVAFTITVTNQSDNPALNLAVALPLPSGALPADGTSEKLAGWSWTLPRLEGRASTQVTGQLRLDSAPTGNALVLNVSVTADGLTAPIQQRGGAIVLNRAQSPGSARFTPGQIAQLLSSDGRVRVDFPGAALTRGLVLSAVPLELVTTDLRTRGSRIPPPVVGAKRAIASVVLDARDDQGAAVHQFSAPVTLRMRYTPEELDALGIAEQHLAIFWFDEQQGAWLDLGGQVDPGTRSVTLQVDHFSAYALGDGSSPSAAFIPSLKGGQVALQTGSATYNYDLDLPAGPGGLKPSLSLAYNSGSLDGAGGYYLSQGGWAGRGWSLDTGSVARNTIKTNESSAASYFTLVLNGASYPMLRAELLPGFTNPNDSDNSHWRWRSANEGFVQVRLFQTGTSNATRGGYHNNTALARHTWVAWTKDGTRYEFAEDLWWGFDNCRTPAFTSNMQAYKWLLSKVVDVHGNTMSYQYARNSYSGFNVCGNNRAVVDRDAWPTSITWGGNSVTGAQDRYRVTFVSSARGYDTSFSFADNQYLNYQTGSEGSPRQTRKLDHIVVESKPVSAWEMIRRYDLAYEVNAASNTNLVYADRSLVSGSSWVRDPAYPKLTLKSITRVGKDGTLNPPTGTALPATSFFYGTTRGTGEYANAGWNRLANVDNGQGGTLSYGYEHIAPVFAGQSWRNLFKDHHRVVSKTITTAPSGTAYDSYRQSATWQYVYDNTNGRPNYNNLGTTLEPLTWSTQSVPNSAALYMNKYYDLAHAEANKVWLVTKKNTEYRGHPYVKEIVPDGGQTEHWYYLGDIAGDAACPYGYPSAGSNPLGSIYIEPDACFRKLRDREFLKGKQYRTRFWGSSMSGNPLKETARNYGVDFYGYSYGYLQGLWRAFSYESAVAEGVWEGTTTPLTTTTRSYYTPAGYQDGGVQYGNLTRIEVYTDTALPAYRVTENYYATRNIEGSSTFVIDGSYLVDRVWMTTVKDGAGNLLSLTHNFYDANNTSVKTLGSRGLLTRTSKYYDVPASDTNVTLHSVDTTYAYDSYGNQTAETSYAGPGTRLYNGSSYSISAPGGGNQASTSTTTFDGTFHVFSIQSVTPVGNGTALTETAEYDYRMGTLIKAVGPNGDAAPGINCANIFVSGQAAHTTAWSAEVQCAAYDLFGRMVATVKSGDTGQYPSLLANYHDFETPFRYTYEQRPTAGSGTTRMFQQYYDGIGQLLQTKAESQNGTHNLVIDKRYDKTGRVIEVSQPREAQADDVAPYDSGYPFTAFIPQPAAGQPLYNASTTQYDTLGRVRLTTGPDGSQSELRYGLTTISGLGLVKTVDSMDANRHRATQWSDGFDRLLGVQEWSGDCGTLTGVLRNYSCGTGYTAWASYAETAYQYDRLDQLMGVTDDAGNRTTMTYDSLGRKLSMSDPDMGAWNYSYDVDGNLLTQTDANGQTLWFRYDELNRTLEKRHDNATGMLLGSLVYDQGPNGKGRLTTSSNANVTKSLQYDSRGRTTQVTYTNLPGLTDQGGSVLTSRIFNWTYDNADRIVTVTYPRRTGSDIREIVKYTYNFAGQSTSLLGDRTNDGIYEQTYISGASYDLFEQPISLNFGNGIQQTWTYASLNRRLERLQVGVSGALGRDFDRGYSYDLVGNIATITDNKASGNSQSYAYDHRDRLTSWTLGGNSPQTYTYNELGNLTKKGDINYSYPTNGVRPHAVSSTAPGKSYGYDGNGNMTTIDGAPRYTWTRENLPATIIGVDAIEESYAYDPDQGRIKKTRNGLSTFYLGGLWEETSAGGSKASYSFNGKTIAVRDSSAGLSYLHGDHLGSVSLSSTPAGVASVPQEFDPWGVVRSGSISLTSHNYTGQRRDETGLLYYNARMYDPALGRFISADSIVRGVGALTLAPGDSTSIPLFAKGGKTHGPRNPQDLNRYSYANNNPIIHTDPTGHFFLVFAVVALPVLLLASTPTAQRNVPGAKALTNLIKNDIPNAIKGMVGALTVTKPSAKDVVTKHLSGLKPNTCRDCGTTNPPLIRDGGKVTAQEDGVSLRCAVCVGKGDVPGMNPKEKYWTRPFQDHQGMADKLGYHGPEYTPGTDGRPGHFSGYQGVEEGAVAETDPELNEYIRNSPKEKASNHAESE